MANYSINLGGSTWNWANGTLAPGNNTYKGTSVTGLTTNSNGAPVGFTVVLSHAGVTYQFIFSGGPGGGTPPATVSITYPYSGDYGRSEATTVSDTWEATASPVPPEDE